jgi:hypothetical protein
MGGAYLPGHGTILPASSLSFSILILNGLPYQGNGDLIPFQEKGKLAHRYIRLQGQKRRCISIASVFVSHRRRK